MASKKQMESIGFYHIVNRGVERRKSYMDVVSKKIREYFAMRLDR